MKLFLVLLLGAAAGAGGFWYVSQNANSTPFDQAKARVVFEAGRASGMIQEKTDLTIDKIKEELARSSTVVREKAKDAGRSIASTAENTRLTGLIKARLLAEPGLGSLHINVDTTDGLVTLSGKVDSPEQVAKAIKIALQTDGVHKVISTLQVPGLP